jgi:hypothetical protein
VVTVQLAFFQPNQIRTDTLTRFVDLDEKLHYTEAVSQNGRQEEKEGRIVNRVILAAGAVLIDYLTGTYGP